MESDVRERADGAGPLMVKRANSRRAPLDTHFSVQSPVSPFSHLQTPLVTVS
jgi:hypothetical protein